MNLGKRVFVILLSICVMLPVFFPFLDLLGLRYVECITLTQNRDILASIAALSCLSKFAIIVVIIAQATIVADIRRRVLLSQFFAFQWLPNAVKEVSADVILVIISVVYLTLLKFLVSRIFPQQLVTVLFFVPVTFLLSQVAIVADSGNSEEHPNHNDTDMSYYEHFNESTKTADDEKAAKSSDELSYELSESNDDHFSGLDRHFHEFVNPLYVENDEVLEYIDEIVHQGEPWQYNGNDDYF